MQCAGELRITRDRRECGLEGWAIHPGDRAMMRGALTVDVADLDLIIHGLKRAVWLRDRDGFPHPPKAA